MAKTMALLGILLALQGPAGARPQTEQASPSQTAPSRIYRDVSYRTVGDRNLKVDIYLAPRTTSAPTPALLFLHGGAWWKGSRPADWKPFQHLLAEGISVITVEYRLAGMARAPAAVEDVFCAMHWTGENAARYRLDARRLIVMGTSAGGQLALMAGMLPSENALIAPECRKPPRAIAILDFYGPTDLRTPPGEQRPSAIARWLGDQPDAAKLEHLLSPVNHVRKGLPPVFIVHGTADPVVPLEASLALKRKLDAAGVPTTLHAVEGGVHGKFTLEQQKIVNDRVVTFLREILN